MKTKLFLSMAMIVFLFTQCKKKEEIIENEVSSDLVKVSFELPINESRSDFTTILPDGTINWGNSNNIEYLYLGVNDRYLYYNHELSYTVRVGEMFEMQAEVNEATDKLTFSGMIPQNLLYSSKKCTLYYFGNNGRGGEGTNVTNIYDEKYPECVIGKTISFSKQSGNIEELGNYHVASIPVTYVYTIRDEDRNIIEFQLRVGLLESNMSVAMLDLTNETTLQGSATNLQSYTIKWTGLAFEEFIESSPEGSYDVTGNPGERSFIALLPTEEDATLECGKGTYVFEGGIERNQFYIGRAGSTLEESAPLIWEQP
mgnify:CR=1 FL=1